MKDNVSTDQTKIILDFIESMEGLKKETRHSWLSNGRRESVAEHTWRMAMLSMVLAPMIGQKIDLHRLYAMILVHDIPEILVGDIPVFKKRTDNKHVVESSALHTLTQRLPEQTKSYIRSLWKEFEKGETVEAKLAHACDKLEVIIQHNQAALRTWTKKERTPSYSTEYGKSNSAFSSFVSMFQREISQKTARKLKEIKIP